MELYNIPKKITTLIFDIDGTLYTSPAYVFEQVDVQIRHWAHINNMSDEEARKKISNYRHQWAKDHDGQKISLGNTFTAFGISIDESIKWRNALMEPEKYLKRDNTLIAVLNNLKPQYKMICVTNNPVDAARRTLKAIGIDQILPDIIGLDTCYKSKPAIEVLQKALDVTQSQPENCISIGDRYDIDLRLPLSLGMGGILVSGVEDLYSLDCTLRKHQL